MHQDDLQKGDKMWPSQAQRLLLTAALSSHRKALKAWKKWCQTENRDQLDKGSMRLLPLVFNHLKRFHQEKSLHPLQSLFFSTVEKNKTLFNNALPLFSLFHQNNIKVYVLKGGAINLLYLDTAWARPMDDLDILIHPADRDRAIRLMLNNGWQAQDSAVLNEVLAGRLSHLHAYGFIGPNKGVIDLHWSIFHEGDVFDLDNDVRAHAVTIPHLAIPLYALNPTDLLLHVCKHAFHANTIPTIRWIADATILLKKKRLINWKRFLQHAKKRGFALYLYDTLRYLQRHFSVSLPIRVMATLRRSVSVSDKLAYQHFVAQNKLRVPVTRIDLMKFFWYQTGWQAWLAASQPPFSFSFYRTWITDFNDVLKANRDLFKEDRNKIMELFYHPFEMDGLKEEACSLITLDCLHFPLRARQGAFLRPIVKIKNNGERPLGSFPPYPLFLTYHWHALQEGNPSIYNGARTVLHPWIASESSRMYSMNVFSPPLPGVYRLHITLIQEGIWWFDRFDQANFISPPITIFSKEKKTEE